jgi:hypothetical protein
MNSRRNLLKSLSLSVGAGLVGCSKKEDNLAARGTDTNTGEAAAENEDVPLPEFTTNGAQISGQQIEVAVPLLMRVHELDNQLAKEGAGSRCEHGFCYLGLQLARTLKNEGYWCTPLNSLAIGGTGGDGFHFSFLVQNGRVDASSPVIGSAPDFSAHPPLASAVLAANFENFIRLGLTRGYFGMYMFVHHPATALAAYGSPNWQPANSRDEAADLGEDHKKSRITARISAALGLAPLTYTAEDFHALQDKYKSLLKFK